MTTTIGKITLACWFIAAVHGLINPNIFPAKEKMVLVFDGNHSEENENIIKTVASAHAKRHLYSVLIDKKGDINIYTYATKIEAENKFVEGFFYNARKMFEYTGEDIKDLEEDSGWALFEAHRQKNLARLRECVNWLGQETGDRIRDAASSTSLQRENCVGSSRDTVVDVPRSILKRKQIDVAPELAVNSDEEFFSFDAIDEAPKRKVNFKDDVAVRKFLQGRVFDPREMLEEETKQQSFPESCKCKSRRPRPMRVRERWQIEAATILAHNKAEIIAGNEDDTSYLRELDRDAAIHPYSRTRV